MQHRLTQALALLSTGLLAGVFYYGTFTVVPAFFEVPIEVHLQYRVALMNHNAYYVQILTGVAIIFPVVYALVSGKNPAVRRLATAAAIAALISILVTRFGNVPVNRLMRVWEAGRPPENWREILDRWNMFNNIRTVFALASFILVIIATQVRGNEAAPKK